MCFLITSCYKNDPEISHNLGCQSSLAFGAIKYQGLVPRAIRQLHVQS